MTATLSPRLERVRQFADNVLAAAGDSYHGDRPSPLLADGIDPRSGEQMAWVFPDGRRAILSNFSAQQNLMRVLTGLSNLSGDPRYRQRAAENVRFYFDHYQDAGGLLIWGGHRFVDLKTLQPEGPSEKESVHELKNAYPFYDLMFEVDKEASTRFIRAFWNAHVYNWKTLETSRHGEYGKEAGALWNSEFEQQPPFFHSLGLSFLNTGSDLIYAACTLYQHTGEQGALTWAQRLAEQYVRARHAQTGLGVYQFTQPLKRASTDDDADTLSKYGDRAQRQFGPEFGPDALEGNMLLDRWTSATIYAVNPIMQLETARRLGPLGESLKTWTLDGLKAFARHAYDETQNCFLPLMANGQKLVNYVLPRDGYYGQKGQAFPPYAATGDFLLAYARACALSADETLWNTARGIAHGLTLGDIGRAPGETPALNLATDNDDPYVIFALIELYHSVQHADYLRLAEKVADNLLVRQWHNGWFVADPRRQYADIDSIAPYALLALEACLQQRPDAVSPFINGVGYTEGSYRMPDGSVRVSTRDNEIFALNVGEQLAPNGKR